ncbi:hypothetical protein BCR44DRAFT_1466214 [Catenaria anguillulae PL171]|uniref:Uncharacterized protein n=1 Tax=Catenaria anguillulae PL171 TaxID=765915 RepID=A0A1Y2H4R4_9FUNG|nr:hypothetical protein BCR44DRAFT_1466214 [Catenaria anguillulae PL171]
MASAPPPADPDYKALRSAYNKAGALINATAKFATAKYHSRETLLGDDLLTDEVLEWITDHYGVTGNDLTVAQTSAYFMAWELRGLIDKVGMPVRIDHYDTKLPPVVLPSQAITPWVEAAAVHSFHPDPDCIDLNSLRCLWQCVDPAKALPFIRKHNLKMPVVLA